MDLSKIISLAGKSGLYRIVAQGRQALIAESLEDGKRIPVHASVKVSSLDDISMFTKGDDVPLSEVLAKLHTVEKGKPSLDPKGDVEALFAKLGEALPDHDRDRIYPSDVRKLFTWYALLLKSGDLKEKKKDSADDKKDEKGTEKAAKAAPKKAAKAAGETVKKAAVPKPGASSKSKGASVRKSAQRGA